MMLLNIEYIPGKRIEALGLVKGTTVYSKSFGTLRSSSVSVISLPRFFCTARSLPTRPSNCSKYTIQQIPKST